MTGVFASDYSDASNTNLFDLEARAWATDLVAASGLDPAKLPPLFPSTAVIGHVTAQAAALTGLLAGTPVVIGGGDGACATVGAGAVHPGDAYINIGSSAWLAVTARRPLLDPEMRTFNLAHLDPDLVMALGSMQAAGGAFDWLERLLRGEAEGDLHEALSSPRRPCRRAPTACSSCPTSWASAARIGTRMARGAFVGLTMTHGRPEMARAVLEGVAFNLRLILDALQAQEIEIPAMRLIGGGARSPLWRQILADVLGLPILLPELVTEATSLGAAHRGRRGRRASSTASLRQIASSTSTRLRALKRALRPTTPNSRRCSRRPTAAWSRSSASYADPINPFLAFDNPHVLWYVTPNMCYG